MLHGTFPVLHVATAAFLAAGLGARFELSWVKTVDGRPLRTAAWVSDAKPLRAHEGICVFSRGDARAGDLTFNLGAMSRVLGPGRKANPRIHTNPSRQRAGWSRDYRSKLRPGQGWPVDVIFTEPAHGVDLYAQKPEELTAYLVALLTDPGGTVLDPYAGSGTTLRVAWHLGRRSVGFEAQPERFIALQREFA